MQESFKARLLISLSSAYLYATYAFNMVHDSFPIGGKGKVEKNNNRGKKNFRSRLVEFTESGMCK